MKTLFLILLTSLTFAQSPFWKMELMENETASSTPDITTGLVALWQNGDTVDVTGRGNDLSASHTNPDTTNIPEWSVEVTYNQNDLVTFNDTIWVVMETTATYSPSIWTTYFAPFSDSTAIIWYEANRSYYPGTCVLFADTIWRMVSDGGGNGNPGNGNNAWVVNAPQVVNTTLSEIPNAIQFNGVDNYLSRASTTDLQLGGTDFTISCWVKSPSAFGRDIVNKGTAWYAMEYDLVFDDGPYWRFDDAFATPMISMNNADSYYHHIVVVYSDSCRMYVDGVVQPDPAILTIGVDSNDFSVGKAIVWGWFDGQIAQLAIYKRALTQEQIAYLYNGGDGRLIDVVSTPRNIAAVGDTNKVTLTWTDPTQSDFDSVRVYAGTTANPTTWIASVAKGVQTYKDSNYTYGTIRHYRLKALTTSGDTSNYTSSVNDTVMIWLGSELLTNTNFESNTTGWAGSNGTIKWYNTDWNAVSRVNALLDSATTTSSVNVIQYYAFTSGYKYRLDYTYYIPSTNATAKKIVWAFIGGSNLFGVAQSVNDSWTTNTEYLTATASHASLRVYQANSAEGTSGITSGDKIYIDNVSVKRILNP